MDFCWFLTGIFSDGDLFFLGDQFSASSFQPFATCNWCKCQYAPVELILSTCKVAIDGQLCSFRWCPAKVQSMNFLWDKKSFLGDWVMWPPFSSHNLGRCVEAIGWSICTLSHLFFGCKLSMAKGATLRRTPVADMACCTMASRWLKCSSVGSWPVHMRLSIHIQQLAVIKKTPATHVFHDSGVSLAWMCCVVKCRECKWLSCA